MDIAQDITVIFGIQTGLLERTESDKGKRLEEKKMKKLSIDDLMAEIWAAGWNSDREKYDNAAYEIRSRFENIKCCGNCENWFEHKCYCFHNWNPHKYCKAWVSDGLTTEIRGF
jgi:hypothetical protein